MRRFWAILLIVGFSIAGQTVSYATPLPQGHPNGSVDSLWQYAGTSGATYYHLVYYSDNLKVTAYYAEPTGKGPYPAVIYNRGGNRDTGALNGTELAAFAESGFVVVATQYRGVAGGEGREEFGGADVHDVTNLITFLKSRPLVDPKRIVMFGGSRGGMMTYLALKWQSQNRLYDIKAAATVGGLADLFMWAKQRPELDGFYAELIGATTTQNPQALRDRSATYWPQYIRVPLLIEHGGADTEVSIQQSLRLYNLLRSYGRVVKYVTYPDGDHPLSNHDAGLPEAFKWFQRFIGKKGDNFDYFAHIDAIRGAQAMLMGRG